MPVNNPSTSQPAGPGPAPVAPTPEAIAKCDADYNKTVADAETTRTACKTGTPSKKGLLGFWGLGGKKSKSQKKRGGKKSQNKKRGGKKSKSQKKR